MSKNPFLAPLIDPSELHTHLNDPNLILLEAKIGSVHSSAKSPQLKHLPNARIFDLEQVKDHSTSLPHMMPDPSYFEKCARELGIDSDSKIVVYDPEGIYAGPRIRWMFKAMGHELITVLNGGLTLWERDGYPISAEIGQPPNAEGSFSARMIPKLFCDASDVEQAIKTGRHCLIDARNSERYQGAVSEPRPGLRQGHIPTAVNIPFESVLDSSGALKTVPELRAIFHEISRDHSPIIFYCGSGVTACITAIAAESIGLKPIQIYDGSWSEWGIPSDRPIET